MPPAKSVLYLLVIAALLLAACQQETPAPTQPPSATAPTATPPPTAVPTETPIPIVTGGVLTIGILQEPGTLNPLLASLPIENAVSALAVEGLVEVDADGQYVPALAEELPAVSDDGLTVTYKLQAGVKFSNGDAFTCADVQFTRDAALAGVSAPGYRAIEAIDCPDDHTVVINFAEIYAPYLRLFSFILPQAAGDPAALEAWEYNRAPIGTGPWRVKEWEAGQAITFEKNPNYREAGKPYLDSLTLRVVPDPATGLQLLGSGEIDVMWGLAETDIAQLKELDSQGVDYVAAATGENELLALNLADPNVDAPADPAAIATRSDSNRPHPILGDLRVRQAIQLGIDKQSIIDTLLSGEVNVGSTVLPAGIFACPQAPGQYDPQQGMALLEESGWTAGADGIRAKDSLRLSLKLQSTAGDKLREDAEQLLAGMMKAIGIELVIENVPADEFFAGWESQGLRKHGNFDIVMYTAGPGSDPDSYLFNNYHSVRIPNAANDGAGANYSRYLNAKVDAWLDQAAATTDVAVRKEAYCNVAAQINDDLPRIFLYERLFVAGYRSGVQNFHLSPGPDGFAPGSDEWWIKP